MAPIEEDEVKSIKQLSGLCICYEIQVDENFAAGCGIGHVFWRDWPIFLAGWRNWVPPFTAPLFDHEWAEF